MDKASYQIKQEDGKFNVYNTATDKKVGSYDTRAQAMNKMKELYKKPGKASKAADAEDAAENGPEDD